MSTRAAAVSGDAGAVGCPRLRVVVGPALRRFLHHGWGRGDARGELVVEIAAGDPPSLGHVVQSMGVPLTEVGMLRLDDRPAQARTRAPGGGTLEVMARHRPQPAPTTPPRFLLDVHLGALARRMRLLGLDVAYRNDAGDDDLVTASLAQQRVLLTRDRGLLMRRALRWAAYVHGQHCDDQIADVLERFAPPLRPWTRCVACNGLLEEVDVADIADQLQPGTLRTYSDFVRCTSCGQPFWRGAHARRLHAAVAAGTDIATAAQTPDPPTQP